MNDEKQADIIRRVYAGSYSHVENILLRLLELEEAHGTEKAIDILHQEIEP